MFNNVCYMIGSFLADHLPHKPAQPKQTDGGEFKVVAGGERKPFKLVALPGGTCASAPGTTPGVCEIIVIDGGRAEKTK